MKLEEIKRGQIVKLNIPAMNPIKTLRGDLHESGQFYKVLGFQGTLVRLSRLGDFKKLSTLAESLVLHDGSPISQKLPKKEAYMVMSISDIEKLLQVARLIAAKHGYPDLTGSNCVILGIELRDENEVDGQLQAKIDGARCVADKNHYNERNTLNGELMPHRGAIKTCKQ